MRALVTGAGGFVGRHLVDHLAAQGDDVAVTDREIDGLDLLDSAALARRMSEVAPEVVYHLGGQADVAASWNEPAATLRTNAEGTLNVVQACASAGVAKVIVVSSAEVYGAGGSAPLGEDRPLAPANPYAASKAAAEMVCLAWQARGPAIVRVRPFNHLGPGQSEAFVAPGIAGRLLRAVRDGRDHVPVGNLDAARDFTDVRDVVRAYRLIATGARGGEIFNVCSGWARPIGVLVEEIRSLIGTDVELRLDPALARPADVPVIVGDASRLRARTGWRPEIPLERTLRDLVTALADVVASEPRSGHDAASSSATTAVPPA